MVHFDKNIKDKIKELFNSTPPEVGVGFGRKFKKGVYTGENTIVFTVEKKKPLSELSPNEILPPTVIINGVKYTTDVREVGKVRTLACDPTVINTCYEYDYTPPTNRNKIRPIVGGLQITADHNSLTWGTLGIIAIDNVTSGIVGITNNHVVIGNAFYTSERSSSYIENELDNSVYQNYDFTEACKIGEVIRYVPIRKYPSVNLVDGALVSIDSSVFSFSESFKQHELSYTSVMPFASTAEIESMVGTTLYSSGARTGAKEGVCQLVVDLVGAYSTVGPYSDGGIEQFAYFADLIAFTRENYECPYPIDAGDSGSALIADFSGTWKIIGLCFAGSEYIGYACRIDNVMSQLGISQWDGTTKPFIDLNSREIVTSPGTSTYKNKVCDGTIYWQIGNGMINNPC